MGFPVLGEFFTVVCLEYLLLFSAIALVEMLAISCIFDSVYA